MAESHLVLVAFVALIALVQVSTGYVVPTPRQEEYMEMGFTQFMHFSVTTFGKVATGKDVEHDCINGKCLPASAFNPSNLSTDQWVETAVNMGAGEICLTAHHEGGFCLWPTKYQNYSVETSGLWARGQKVDIVQEFVQSCRKYNVKPCFYIGPNANGYQTQVIKASPKEFVERQFGMITEVLTNYGFIDRLWWDHYEQKCGGLSECPKCTDEKNPYCFPKAWANFTTLVRTVSPGTLMGTGPDVAHSAGGESGAGQYPAWNTCNTTDGSPLSRCNTYGTDPHGTIFRPFETDATIQNPGDAWFWHEGHAYWKSTDVWDHYFATVGRGTNFILNMPPDITGQIPEYMTKETDAFGAALKKTMSSSLGKVENLITSCNVPVEIDFKGSVAFDMIETKENMLVEGQKISGYAIDAFSDGKWVTLPSVDKANNGVHGQTVGIRIVDFFAKPITAEKIRWRCTAQENPGDISIRAITVRKASPPAGCLTPNVCGDNLHLYA